MEKSELLHWIHFTDICSLYKIYHSAIISSQLLILISLPEVSTNPHIRNFFNSTGNPDDVQGNGTETLKLSVSHKCIRYFIERSADATIVFYGDYSLQSVSGNEDLREQLSNILSKDSFLNKTYSAVKICWFTDFEIIPAIFFDADEMGKETAFNKIMNGEANFVFEVPAALSTVLQNKFGTIEHYHSGAAMIERLRKEALAKSDKLFININADNIEIACFDDEMTLKIYNRYEYKAYQDYIYFVLLVADEMKINREEVKAVLIGEVSQDSQLYEMTNRYFMNIAFIGRPHDMNFSRSFDEYPKHFNYPLYNL